MRFGMMEKSLARTGESLWTEGSGWSFSTRSRILLESMMYSPSGNLTVGMVHVPVDGLAGTLKSVSWVVVSDIDDLLRLKSGLDVGVLELAID